MDNVRLGLLIWLLIPIPVYGLIRCWYNAQIRKFPSITLGKIVDIVSYGDLGEYDTVGSSNVIYSFTVADTEYTGRATLYGRHYKTGQVLPIPICYNPNRPEESRLDNLRDVVRGWVYVGLFVLSIDLGVSFFPIYLGLICLFVGFQSVRGRLTTMMQISERRRLFLLLMCILMGLSLIAIGVYMLMDDGFLSQNILWAIWNHD